MIGDHKGRDSTEVMLVYKFTEWLFWLPLSAVDYIALCNKLQVDDSAFLA